MRRTLEYGHGHRFKSLALRALPHRRDPGSGAFLHARYRPIAGTFLSRSAVSDYKSVALLLEHGAADLYLRVASAHAGRVFLLSAHMLTMMLVIFVVAPLLLSLPGWLIAPIALHPVIKPVLRFLTRPVVNVLHFNLAFLLIHIPLLLKTLMFSTDALHYLTYFAIFGSAVLMFWPVMNPLPGALPSPPTKCS